MKEKVRGKTRQLSRRDFIKTAAAVGAASSVLADPQIASAAAKKVVIDITDGTLFRGGWSTDTTPRVQISPIVGGMASPHLKI